MISEHGVPLKPAAVSASHLINQAAAYRNQHEVSTRAHSRPAPMADDSMTMSTRGWTGPALWITLDLCRCS